MPERGCYLPLSNSHPADTWRLESKYQFVYIVGWDFSPTFLLVWFDNKCWTKVQHSDSISPTTTNLWGCKHKSGAGARIGLTRGMRMIE